MSRTSLGLAIGCAVAVAATPAVAAAPSLNIVGGGVMKPNRWVKDTQRFARDVTVVSSGDTLTVRNRTKGEPHTFSLVKRSDLPRRMSQMEACFEKGVCGQFFGAHEVPEGDGPPGKPLVDVGDEGFESPGDSVIINSKGAPGSTAKLKITAAKGKTLYFLCAIHPWMQGQVKVRK